jgi:class 3 adenylate cyclase
MKEEDLKSDEERLWKLVEQRTLPDADTALIDERIWDLFGGDWAVMFTDLSGFSRQVARFGIIHFLQEMLEQKRLLLPVIARHDGILIKIEADSLMVIFRRPAAAVRCAVEMQHACQRFNLRRMPEDQVLLCVGVGYGRILRIGDRDVFGAEVNAASKLGEDIAQANEILVTESVRAAAGDGAGVDFVDLVRAVPGSERNWRLIYPPAG